MARVDANDNHDAGDLDGRFAAAIKAFEERFGRRPTLAAAAPGRINLIGEHTDYNNGFVLPMAIDRHTVIVADLAPGNISTLAALDLNKAATVDLTAPLSLRAGRFENYLLGVASEFARRGHTLVNLDVVIASDIPIGAGLSSSAALEVAFALIQEQATGVTLEPLDRAALCQAAEHSFPGTPCGIMDMFTATMARAGHALFIDCRSMKAQHIAMPPEDAARILVVNTGVKHDLASSAYAARRQECQDAAKMLGLSSLRDATLEMLNADSVSPLLHRRALHVIAENTRTVLGAQTLASCNLNSLGELMFSSHESLRDLYEVSCSELDVVVDAARDLRGRGVFGGRMTGGGFGGCAIVLCKTDALEAVKEEIQTRFAALFRRPCDVFTVSASGAARPVPV